MPRAVIVSALMLVVSPLATPAQTAPGVEDRLRRLEKTNRELTEQLKTLKEEAGEEKEAEEPEEPGRFRLTTRFDDGVLFAGPGEEFLLLRFFVGWLLVGERIGG